VTDDGDGYDARLIPIGSGLRNMADRVAALGGRLKVQSAAGQGTAIIGQLPISGSNRNHQRAEAAGRFPTPPRRRPVGCNNDRLPTTSGRAR
jgi:signal transduction histidine kinase